MKRNVARDAAVVALVSLTLAGCNSTMPTAAPAPSAPQPASPVAIAPSPAPAPPAAGVRYGPDGCKYLPTAQAAPPTTNTQNAVIGAVAGAVVGGAIGRSSARTASVGTRNGALIGAVAGAFAGSQFNNLVGMTEQPDGTVKLDIPGKVLFRTGSAEISPDFLSVLGNVGTTIREWCGVTATVVGHTDSTGSAAGNQRLSERRAASVVNALKAQGLEAGRLSAEGRGPSEPIADNRTEDGRAQNRRVEVFIRPPAM